MENISWIFKPCATWIRRQMLRRFQKMLQSILLLLLLLKLLQRLLQGAVIGQLLVVLTHGRTGLAKRCYRVLFIPQPHRVVPRPPVHWVTSVHGSRTESYRAHLCIRLRRYMAAAQSRIAPTCALGYVGTSHKKTSEHGTRKCKK